MLTRKIALARLREFGTLADTPGRLTMVAPKPPEVALARELVRLVVSTQTASSGAPAWAAPAACQSVLP